MSTACGKREETCTGIWAMQNKNPRPFFWDYPGEPVPEK